MLQTSCRAFARASPLRCPTVNQVPRLDLEHRRPAKRMTLAANSWRCSAQPSGNRSASDTQALAQEFSDSCCCSSHPEIPPAYQILSRLNDLTKQTNWPPLRPHSQRKKEEDEEVLEDYEDEKKDDEDEEEEKEEEEQEKE